MAKNTPQGATACGSHCYLFKSSTNSIDCLISAHGGFVSENRSFTVPQGGLKILFYGVHGAALQDPNITSFARKMSQAVPVEELVSGQNCRNYLLSKYQGAHAGESGTEVVETYAQVSDTVSGRDRIRQAQFTKLANTQGPVSTQDKVFTDLIQQWGGSILTIRNRWDVMMGVPLADAIKAARKEMPTLKNFHCIFCRSTMLPDNWAKKRGHTNLPSVGVNYR